jgi:hypothetical protein
VNFHELCDQFDATDSERLEIWTYLCFIRFRAMILNPTATQPSAR